MKRAVKRALALGLTFSMVLAMCVGCGGKDVTDNDVNDVEWEDDTQNADSNSYNPYANSDFDVTTAEMPTRELENKVITYYSWTSLEEELNADTYGAKSLLNIMQKEFGVTFEQVAVGTHENYWSTLATLIASGNAPDIVKLPNWNCYPAPVSMDLLQPLDDLIDFSNPIWDDTKEAREAHKWNGKTYIPYAWEQLHSWFFYNKQMFKDYGLSNQTPYDLWKEDKWTWEAMEELANQFVKKDASGEVVQWGMAMQNTDLLAATGLELVDTEGNFNIKDSKVATLMNMVYDMSSAGTGAMAPDDAVNLFKDGKVAMCTTTAYAMLYELNDMRLNDNLGWVPLPKMDENSEYYNQTRLEPGFAICKGASNPEAAALFIEMHKWYYTGYSFDSSLPRAQQNACMLEYKIGKNYLDKERRLSEEEIDYTMQFINQKYKNISIGWQGWLDTQTVPGFSDVVNGTANWSTTLEKIFPANQATINSYLSNKE